MRTRFYLHVGLWCVLFAIFLAISVPLAVRAVLENKIGPINPNHSTDAYLDGLTHVRNGSELFSRFIESTPRDKSIVIVVDAQSSPGKFLGMIVAYLAWPRDVQTVAGSPGPVSRGPASVQPGPAVAVVFF